MTSDRFRSWFIGLSAILNHPLTAYTRDLIEKRITDRVVAEQLAPMLIRQTASLQSSDLTGLTSSNFVEIDQCSHPFGKGQNKTKGVIF
jgi:hypothetical protein